MSSWIAAVSGKPRQGPQIVAGPELQRVMALPRRAEADPDFIAQMSAYLRTRTHDANGRENLLFGPQAAALRELWEYRGLVAPMRVGSGKTLVTLLAPYLLQATRPVLILPAAMFKRTRKTQREFAEYRENWHVRLPLLVSYEELGRASNEHKLFRLDPDLVILDEAHMIRNLDAAVTRRVQRLIEYRRPVVAMLSGTLITDHLMDYHHMLTWTLRERAPVPLRPVDAEAWAQALDKDVGTMVRRDPGALRAIPGGFHDWMRASRGVVPTPGSDCDAGIEVQSWQPTYDEDHQRLIMQVQETGMRPDGELLDEWELPVCLSQLALKFFYTWDPLPPLWWLQPRRAWRGYVRGVLDEHVRGYDSEWQIVRALDHGTAPPLNEAEELWLTLLADDDREALIKPVGPPPAAREGKALLEAWRAVKDRFEPNNVPVWYGDEVMRQAVDWTEPGSVIWTRFHAAGEKLRELGVPYFPGGTDPLNAPAGQTVALSIAAFHKGLNLQARHRALVLTLMADPNAWEQLIGRFHRTGQTADTVTIGVIEKLEYHTKLLRKVRHRAKVTAEASGFSQKLVDATWT